MSHCPDVLILLMSQVPVLITGHHMCTPGQPFFFQLYCIHPQSMQSLKHRRIQRPVDWRGNGHVDRCKGWLVFAILICHEVMREHNTWSVKQFVSQILQRPCKWRCFHNGVVSYKVNVQGVNVYSGRRMNRRVLTTGCLFFSICLVLDFIV